MTDLYPEIEPFTTGRLDVGDGHNLYWEISGNPDGQPILFLHGGPGSGTRPWQRQLFNPQKYKIILLDQRGSGKSTPHASIENNTTPDLVADIEKLRVHLGLSRWAVFGGSWGSTLALAYADRHAERIDALVMYGIFLCRDAELRALYFEGGVASQIFPDLFAPYIALLPPEDRADPIAGYKKLFESPDAALRRDAVILWTELEYRVSRLSLSAEEAAQSSQNVKDSLQEFNAVLSHSLLENHYFMHKGFLDADEILKNIGQKIAGIPTHIIQGRYDIVCPFITAWQLHIAVPHSRLHVVEAAGHSGRAPEMRSVLVNVLDSLDFNSKGNLREHRV